ncbi:hypothetical protein B566_EDAN016418 [Ephemera danica]|nr:hypothetical protein B566_EDAN016418 [Ephemera danica]
MVDDWFETERPPPPGDKSSTPITQQEINQGVPLPWPSYYECCKPVLLPLALTWHASYKTEQSVALRHLNMR